MDRFQDGDGALACTAGQSGPQKTPSTAVAAQNRPASKQRCATMSITLPASRPAKHNHRIVVEGSTQLRGAASSRVLVKAP
eukprot:COSAG01_NODE_319_length_18909_cov_32.636151_4_plen_81_part_00